eukprot:TRINITY_DN14405_c0_g2_i2.p1 TRINITY_DN14405_c0_g2~~TRINITY_DN14405_c0_g2_i2.p1  ORF type:complete len:400 (+),score=-9.69 TRINITY_DN14405_c0_g2_i2:63-1262(+)
MCIRDRFQSDHKPSTKQSKSDSGSKVSAVVSVPVSSTKEASCIKKPIVELAAEIQTQEKRVNAAIYHRPTSCLYFLFMQPRGFKIAQYDFNRKKTVRTLNFPMRSPIYNPSLCKKRALRYFRFHQDQSRFILSFDMSIYVIRVDSSFSKEAYHFVSSRYFGARYCCTEFLFSHLILALGDCHGGTKTRLFILNERTRKTVKFSVRNATSRICLVKRDTCKLWLSVGSSVYELGLCKLDAKMDKSTWSLKLAGSKFYVDHMVFDEELKEVAIITHSRYLLFLFDVRTKQLTTCKFRRGALTTCMLPSHPNKLLLACQYNHLVIWDYALGSEDHETPTCYEFGSCLLKVNSTTFITVEVNLKACMSSRICIWNIRDIQFLRNRLIRQLNVFVFHCRDGTLV